MPNHPETVFVTGATGFVGRYIVKHLVKGGFRVRILVRRVPQQLHDPSVEVVIGDLSQPETYAAGVDGVSAVVHSALTEDLSREPRATSALQTLSVEMGVRKFVHLSSIVVYGNPAEGNITEETPLILSTSVYARTKLAIEDAVRTLSGVPETLILRLGCVYGPGGGWWSQGLLSQMQRGKLILVNEGSGTANLIHVSDVGALIVLLLRRANPALEIYNVTDGTPVTWRRYFSELEALIGRTATVSMTAAEVREHGKRWLRPSLARRAIRKISGAELVYPMDEGGIEAFSSRAVYSNQKASTMLGFKPEYDLTSGVRTLLDGGQQLAGIALEKTPESTPAMKRSLRRSGLAAEDHHRA